MPEQFHTVAEVVSGYLPSAQARLLPSSFKGISSICRRFAHDCGQLELSCITDDVFRRWLNSQDGLSTKTKQWAEYQLRKAFAWANERGLLPPVDLDLRDRRDRPARPRPVAPPVPAPVIPTDPLQRALQDLARLVWTHPVLRGRIYIDYAGTPEKGVAP